MDEFRPTKAEFAERLAALRRILNRRAQRMDGATFDALDEILHHLEQAEWPAAADGGSDA